MKRNMAALVIGNAEYVNGGKLKNPTNDATDMASKLTSFGFQVLTCLNGTHKEMDAALSEFRTLLADNDVGLFYFAGHGVQIDGLNYLIAIDSDTIDEINLKHSALPLNKIIESMDKSDAEIKIMILDACRDNPWERAWKRTAATRGLANVYAPKGTIIGFATSPGQAAGDGKGRNGIYTGAILQHIDESDCAVETMFKRVRNTVAAETASKQITWEHTSLSGNFYFNISLGKQITSYPGTSLADSLLILDEKYLSHQIIKSLKSANWYVQNPAIQKINLDSVKKITPKNLFVIGRNIYQSACGGANAAIQFINEFANVTVAFPNDCRKALLDGMLFEVFFDKKANLRPSIKREYFNELFELKKHYTLSESFDFISEALVASRGSFYVIPGRDHDFSVTIVAKPHPSNKYLLVSAVYADGKNLMRIVDDEEIDDDDFDVLSVADFEKKLSEELVVPLRSLRIAYSPHINQSGKLSVPTKITLKKPIN